MKYVVYTHCHDSQSKQLSQTLQGKLRDVTVYVIGVEDHVALAALLSTGQPDPTRLIMKETQVNDVGGILAIAHVVKFIESIGKPDGRVTEAQLVTLANQRIKVLEAQNGSV